MKSIPLKTWEVQAILDGRKTQTRRVIKPRDPWKPESDGSPAYVPVLMENGEWGWSFDGCIYGIIGRSPYQPGDILWVRETWATVSSGIIEYKATYIEPYTGSTEIDHIGKKITWRPSVRMPKEAARIWLEVEDVRVERVQDIRPEDCESEGIDAWCDDGIHDPSDALRKQFHNLWDTIYAKRGLGWDTNPWVWVIEFKVVKP